LKADPPEGKYFNGNKDDTLTLEKDDRVVWKAVQDNGEYCTLGKASGAKYLGHLIVA
jgi:hypothetical protein